MQKIVFFVEVHSGTNVKNSLQNYVTILLTHSHHCLAARVTLLYVPYETIRRKNEQVARYGPPTGKLNLRGATGIQDADDDREYLFLLNLMT